MKYKYDKRFVLNIYIRIIGSIYQVHFHKTVTVKAVREAFRVKFLFELEGIIQLKQSNKFRVVC